MLDLPLAFWTSSALLLFIEGRRRPWLHLAIALPLAGAILTKSVLGLLAVPIMAAACLHPDWRPRRAGWLCAGVALGMGLGASWTIHQGLTIGPHAVYAHYWGEIGSRAERGVRSAVGGAGLSADPAPALPTHRHSGAARLHRPRPESSPMDGGGGPAGRVGAVADPAVQPVGGEVATLPVPDSAPAGPVCEPLAATRAPGCRAPPRHPGRPRRSVGGGRDVRRVAGGPHARSERGPFKRHAELIQERVAAEEPLPYLGRRFWEHANPLLYYAERRLATPAPDADAAVVAALNHPSRLLLCDRDLLADLAAVGTIGSDRGRGRPLGTAGFFRPCPRSQST